MPVFLAFVFSGTTTKSGVVIGFVAFFVLTFAFFLVAFYLAVVEFGDGRSTEISRLKIVLNVVDKSQK